MKYWIGLMRQPVPRLVVGVVALLAVAKIATYPTGSKLLGVTVVALLVLRLFREWKACLPRFHRMLVRRTMRVMKALRPFDNLPPAVPVLYGVAAMYILVKLTLTVMNWVSGGLSPSDLVTIGTIGMAGALIHAYSLVVKVARWSWSKVLGKILYLVISTVCLALGHADAVRTTRLLVRADARYFPSFVGLLSSLYVCVNIVRAIAVLMSVCGVLLFLINVPPIVLRGIRAYLPWVHGASVRRLLHSWRRVRFNDRQADAALPRRGGPLRDFIDFFTPLALISVAPFLVFVPDAVMKAPVTSTILERLLFATEYTADSGCTNVAGNQPTVYLEGDFVSVASVDKGRLKTIRLTCHVAPLASASR